MGCLSGLAALLALAVPASIARASLVGAYVVLVLLVAAGLAGARWAAQRRAAAHDPAHGELRPARATAVILGTAVGYAVVIAVIHSA